TPGPEKGDSLTQVLASLMGERAFALWFRNKTRLVADNGELIVYAASPFHQKWLQKQHRALVAQAAQSVLGPAARVRFEVDATLPLTAPAESSGQTTATGEPGEASRPATSKADSASRPAAAAEAAVAGPVRQGRRFADLSDFVAGPCNELALTAVRQVC